LFTSKQIINDLKPCSWIYKSETGLGDKTHFGFIAQDLLNSFGDECDFVDQTNEYMKVNYLEFIGVLTSVVKQQQDDIAKLQEQIKELL